jgi:hypothetical protein
MLNLGCPSKLVSIQNNRNLNRNYFLHYPKQNVCFGCFASIPKQSFNVSIEPKQTEDHPKQFDREHILLFFTENFGFSGFFGFLVFFFCFAVCFGTVCFGCFASILKETVSMFRLNRSKQKTHPNSLKESIFGYFLENFGLFRFVT